MNRNYNATGAPPFNSAGSSATIKAEFASISAGFAGVEAELDTKATVNTPGEWAFPGYTLAYISPTQFAWVGIDATQIMSANRRVRCLIGGVYSYSEVQAAVYSSGNTTITLLNAILTGALSRVDYASMTPLGQASASLSLSNLQSIIDAEVGTLAFNTTLANTVSTLTALINSLVPVVVSTTTGNQTVALPTTVPRASYIKSTADAYTVSFTTTDGSTIAEAGVVLDTQNSKINFNKVGTVWYRG